VAIENLPGGRLSLRVIKVGGRKASGGGPLRDLELPPSTLVTLIMRNGNVIVPSGGELVKPEDDVFVLGHTKDIADVTRRLGREVGVVTRAIVVGGGQIGLLATRSLADLDVDVRLIEKDPTRSRVLSEQIQRGEVLCGDGTDVMLLREAGIEGIDLFVAASGQDELNLVLAMLAAELGAQKRVVIVKRRDYLTIVQRLSVDAAISPRAQTAEAILRYIRRPKFTHLATLGENQTEILDTIVSSSSPVTEHPLSDLELPSGLLVGAIVRGSEVVIPSGETWLKAGDNVILFAERDATPRLETVF
jgi:trk system potassium uptake protein TrkA